MVDASYYRYEDHKFDSRRGLVKTLMKIRDFAVPLLKKGMQPGQLYSVNDSGSGNVS